MEITMPLLARDQVTIVTANRLEDALEPWGARLQTVFALDCRAQCNDQSIRNSPKKVSDAGELFSVVPEPASDFQQTTQRAQPSLVYSVMRLSAFNFTK